MKMFREADLMMMPFCTEDFGLVAMEAISADIPVIVNENVSGNSKVFRETDLNVMPICTEGFGLTALEATSAGLPMIVSIFIILNTLQTEGKCDMRDRKPVSVLATIPTSEADESVIGLYNTHRGGFILRLNHEGGGLVFQGFFNLIEVSTSNAHISHCKSPNRAYISSLEFKKANPLGETQEFITSQSLSLISGSTVTISITLSVVTPDLPVRMCPEPCFNRYHILQV
ncbi:unnamed protein product [Pocillopora meandrina]|uniref:Glycosyl transferase family 1 domain-containing protein n=1 Tax=Pocillopora meandrina TaxID=46732 RepID=A0AAU9W1F4_9CNID|nr:unnamed protein product [Pocillopora meandrina]